MSKNFKRQGNKNGRKHCRGKLQKNSGQNSRHISRGKDALYEDDVTQFANDICIAWRRTKIGINGINVQLREAKRQLPAEHFDHLVGKLSFTFVGKFREIINLADFPVIPLDPNDENAADRCENSLLDEYNSQSDVDGEIDIPF